MIGIQKHPLQELEPLHNGTSISFICSCGREKQTKEKGNLMSNIPQYLVLWSIEDIVEGHCQLDDSKA